MALFLIERNFAEQLEVDSEVVAEVKRVNAEEGILWLYSFLRSDNKKTYCLYEAPNPEAIRRAARRLNIPADVIIEVSTLRAEQFPGPAPAPIQALGSRSRMTSSGDS